MPLPPRVPRIERQLIRERVYATLKTWILDGTLRPNETIRDVELAARLGVSRTPLREAVRRLEDEGLIHTAANRWTRVAPIDIPEAERIYPMVWTLEALAVRLAAPHLTADDLKAMDEANASLRRALARRDPVGASMADQEFHAVFIHRADHPELRQTLEWLKAKIRRVEVLYFGGTLVAEASVEEHRRILQALRARDISAAAREVQSNWQNSLGRLRAYLDRRRAREGVPPHPIPRNR
ncbi:MAG: GntR family transcriptional regulator [Armatimonadota bacterium]|nr:GntR family transcriptional regulator [Armatimonadota bacterium]MDR7506245.1 GntR family transcriptional regulator [Armatimonadota bacterium]MDR7508216.1 GntR family transcriptional regulator [Armatimonadota bacterium]MDR7515821.1 GntR family transcriptional regulator [Armatimonadota bacterium]MDR7560740.1 GntR family transcriptional regulator [Armatimonadota bacterium]